MNAMERLISYTIYQRANTECPGLVGWTGLPKSPMIGGSPMMTRQEILQLAGELQIIAKEMETTRL
jgi:hypothetical protein